MRTETYRTRDHVAECDFCDWTWEQPKTGEFEVNTGTEAAKRHAKTTGHRVLVRRVTHIAYTGQPSHGPVPA